MAIGRLESVELRELWKHEESGFSAWLEKNIEIPADAIGISLSIVQREKEVGPFRVDLLAEDGAGNFVLVENQLEPTDHDHLGKLLTFLTNLDAKGGIWITREARPGHMRAVEWLNEVSPRDVAFYLVRIAAYRIGNSTPAPLFTVIVGPSPGSKDVGETKEALAERHLLRLKFWEQLLEKAKGRGLTLHGGRSPSKDNWLGASAGKAGFHYNYVIWLDEKTAVELWIDVGDQAENKRIFDSLHAKKERIEKDFGGPLSWERLDDRRDSRIRYVINRGGLRDDQAKWPAIQEAMVDAMSRLSSAFKPHIAGLHE
jgi:hypothetical protein